MTMLRILCIFFVAIAKVTHGFSDIGKWDLPLNGDNCVFTLAKSLFKDSQLIIMFKCDVVNATDVNINYQWAKTKCSPDYLHYFEQQVVSCTNRVERFAVDLNGTGTIQVLKDEKTKISCQHPNQIIFLEPTQPAETKKDGVPTVSKSARHTLLTVESEGIYVLKMTVSSNKQFKATASIEMAAPSGYLSAAIWPLLPFFGVMCGVYMVLCFAWLLVCSLQWRDLLRIQYWIGGVALLGLIESSTYYAVYSAINSSGNFNTEVYMFAEWLSVAKRALARMLVIIVSLGFGIVKPRLGPALQRVVGTGVLWGILGGINAWLRLHHKANDSNRDLLLSEVPLSLLDSAICDDECPVTKKQHKVVVVQTFHEHADIRGDIIRREWKEVWMDEAYWHMLFASVLTVIMILWRPTNNNQRYAFTPLLDNADDDEEEEEQFVNDAYGVKMRGTNSTTDTAEARDAQEQNNTLDSDLRWVEENIPTSTLPLLDSDEEIINTKFEVSKMQ
ncbi:hypothetical protein SFRURICE_012498 [Spodoptera frugiperda]|nr:hypothetical protein SFRURICE_012498 [Spodoptera frugiperda]